MLFASPANHKKLVKILAESWKKISFLVKEFVFSKYADLKLASLPNNQLFHRFFFQQFWCNLKWLLRIYILYRTLLKRCPPSFIMKLSCKNLENFDLLLKFMYPHIRKQIFDWYSQNFFKNCLVIFNFLNYWNVSIGFVLNLFFVFAFTKGSGKWNPKYQYFKKTSINLLVFQYVN